MRLAAGAFAAAIAVTAAAARPDWMAWSAAQAKGVPHRVVAGEKARELRDVKALGDVVPQPRLRPVLGGVPADHGRRPAAVSRWRLRS